MPVACDHRELSFSSSSHAHHAGYATPSERETAATSEPALNGKRKRAMSNAFGPFCAPLVLPGDDLAEDPEYPAQSVQEWLVDEDRNKVKPKRRTIYVAAPPAIDSTVPFVKSWSEPKHAGKTVIKPPDVKDVAEYLTAFYHGMPVKLLPSSLRLTQWGEKTSKTPRYVGLKTATECVRIRTRASRDGVFSRQLNLDDLLDTAISVLPGDAYGLLLLVPFDIYESPDDDFACGRAYGGSRVAVISTARYHPGLDEHQNVPRLHAWPASHCKSYMEACCSESDAAAARPKKKRKGEVASSDETLPSPDTAAYATLSPLHAAVSAYCALPSLEESPSSAALSALWLGRACRTASHELGHCLGVDHCVYWACCMQSTASLAEDARQPPFLCPVDLAKVLHATCSSRDDRYDAILRFCDKHAQNHLFAALAAWIRAQVQTQPLAGNVLEL